MWLKLWARLQLVIWASVITMKQASDCGLRAESLLEWGWGRCHNHAMHRGCSRGGHAWFGVAQRKQVRAKDNQVSDTHVTESNWSDFLNASACTKKKNKTTLATVCFLCSWNKVKKFYSKSRHFHDAGAGMGMLQELKHALCFLSRVSSGVVWPLAAVNQHSLPGENKLFF